MNHWWFPLAFAVVEAAVTTVFAISYRNSGKGTDLALAGAGVFVCGWCLGISLALAVGP